MEKRCRNKIIIIIIVDTNLNELDFHSSLQNLYNLPIVKWHEEGNDCKVILYCKYGEYRFF